NSFGSALLFKYAGVKNLYGYGTENRGILLKESLPTPQYTVHQTEYYLNLVKLFNITPVHYPLTPRKQRERLVILHPGTSKKERAWHMERFFNVAEHFQRNGWDVNIISGEPLLHSGIPVQVKPTLKEFTDLLMRCSLFIGNDSGP